MDYFYIELKEIVHNRHGYFFSDEFSDAILGPYESERDAIIARGQYFSFLDAMLTTNPSI